MIEITRELAAFCANTTFEVLPSEVTERTKLLILDTAGIIIRARHDAESTPSLIASVERLGLDNGKCSVLGDNINYAPTAAALVNGTLAHSLDYDDTHASASLHSSAPIVPAALAAAELTGASGKDLIVACVGGGSNAMGLFYPFIDDAEVQMVGVEAGGHGLQSGKHAAPLNDGKVGVLHGNRTYLMADEDGQIMETHSISAGLDYPGVGPEHSFLKDIGRAKYDSVTDDEAMSAFRMLNNLEGILPALESSHALAWVIKNVPAMSEEDIVVMNLSGRGDKDILTVAEMDGILV